MFKSVRGRIITIIVVLAMAGWQLWNTYEESCSGGGACSPVKLGLDLQGGMYLVLEPEDPDGTMTPEAKEAAIDQGLRVIRSRIDELGVAEPIIQKVGTERLTVELAGITDQEQARSIVQRAAFLEFKLVRPISDIVPDLPRIDRAIVAAVGVDSIRALGRIVESAPTPETSAIADLVLGGGATDTSAVAAPTDSASVPESTEAADSASQESTLDDESALRPFSSLLNQGNFEGTFLVAAEDVDLAQAFMDLPAFERALPRGIEVLWEEDPVVVSATTFRTLYVLEDDAVMDGTQLRDATAGRDPQTFEAQVQFTLSRAGGAQFSRFTSTHIQDYLAIVLDGAVVSAPEIQGRIGSRGQIDLGGAQMEEASDLALVLRAGALPAPLEIIEERTVGPSLGQDSIDQGRMAGIVGLILVLLIMIAYYRTAGALAIVALAVYVVLVMGGLAGIGATLTLPGIAGLILSIGMAVDANVLIFERIREELAVGRATRTAVNEGFGHALSAIVDANITTLITALILFQVGTGPVRGFAVTLSIGIVASFFSALYVTRTLFLLYLSGKKASDPISI